MMERPAPAAEGAIRYGMETSKGPGCVQME